MPSEYSHKRLAKAATSAQQMQPKAWHRDSSYEHVIGKATGMQQGQPQVHSKGSHKRAARTATHMQQTKAASSTQQGQPGARGAGENGSPACICQAPSMCLAAAPYHESLILSSRQ